MTQVPSPSAAGWLVDLREARGPLFVVLRRTEVQARECLRDHLVDTGTFSSAEEVDEVLAHAVTSPVGVVW